MQSVVDVLVIGGGTAGVIAAVAAARMGARTRLVEQAGYLGGTCHALGNITPFHNSRGEPVVKGLAQELVDRVIRAGGAEGGAHLPNPTGIGGSFTPLDPDIMKAVLFEMLAEAGVDVWLHTRFLESVREGDAVVGAKLANKSGVHAVMAKAVIDATGDADVVASAGAPFHQDVPEAALNASLLFRVGGVDTDAFVQDFKQSPQKVVLLADPYLRDVKKLGVEDVMSAVDSIYDCPYIYLSNLVRDYIPREEWETWEITSTDKSGWGRLRPFASRFSIMPMPKRKSVVTLNVTSITFDATDARELSRAEWEGQKQMHMALEVLQRYVPGFANAYIHSVTPSVSARASRRVDGQYMLTRADIENCTRFPDAIARGSYPMSVQSETQPGVREHLFVPNGGDYDIPYRSLLPKEVDGLLVAGRCLSASREAVGSARMGAQCMAYGHAAGVAAAIAAREGVNLREMNIQALRTELLNQRAIL